MSAGLVSAGGSAIHTTQMQVDEVTVIRLSPIVYNKELVKTVIESDTHPSPTQSKQYMRKRHTDRNNKKKRQTINIQLYRWAHIYIKIKIVCLSFSVYIHICVHTHKYITNIYSGKMRRKIPAGRQGLPRGRIKKSTQRHLTYFSLHQHLRLMSFLFLLRKAELILLLTC